MKKDVIIACDFATQSETLDFLELFRREKPFVKIGMELYYSQGPDIVRRIHDMGHRIFLDLKLHDIPNTVEKAMRVLSALQVDMVNVHAAGGGAMMRAALEGLRRNDGTRPGIIAVTMLTSLDEEILKNELLIERGLEETAMEYALLAKNAGLDGVVCSAHEAGAIHAACGESFLTVTPGIRFEGSERGDQRRVMTPALASQAGSDLIVVGRPITLAPDPVAAYHRCVEEFRGA